MNQQITAGSIIADTYLIKSQLGAGGSGAVYLAEDLSLARKVAVKFLHLVNVDSVALQRFDREAKALSELQHVNIVRVWRYGCLDNGSPYLVMEYLNGESLRAAIDRKETFACNEAVEIGIQICTALEYAHAHRIIHRDLKPENIILCQEQEIVAKVLDFGLCKKEPDAASEDKQATITGTGYLVGTAHYMSPEQCLGLPVDTRSDIYAFGCLLFELITGSPPFAFDSIPEILLGQLSKPFPKLQELSPKSALPAKLQQIIEKCTAKNKDERYPSFHDLLLDLGDSVLLKNSAKLHKGDRRQSHSFKENAARISAGILAAILPVTILCICAAFFFLTSTPNGNIILASQMQTLLPANTAIQGLDELLGKMLAAGRKAAARKVGEDTSNSVVFEKWPQADREKLLDCYINRYIKIGMDDDVFEMRLKLLSIILDSISKAHKADLSYAPAPQLQDMMDNLSKTLLETADKKRWSKIYTTTGKKGAAFVNERPGYMLWPSILRAESMHHERMSNIDRYHDFATECLCTARAAANRGKPEFVEKYGKYSLEACRQHEFLLIENRLDAFLGLYYAEDGNMEKASEELKAADECGKTLLLKQADTERVDRLRKSCEQGHYLTETQYRKIVPEAHRAENPFLQFVK